MTLNLRWLTAVLLASVVVLGTSSAQMPELPPFDRDAPTGPPPPVPEEDAPVPQTRGPVHEGYAQPGTLTPTPRYVVPKAPPRPLDEAPPDVRPEGDSVIWVPGYWAWDESMKDFLWVSGFWRVAPPGRKWVPGYWAHTDDGYAWVSGMWADAGVPEVPYYPEPPAPRDDGPVGPPPDETSIFVPGVWMYREDRFLWRPGYWLAFQPGWVYCPPRWFWTPRGWICTGGFWDRPLARRGVLFAPYAIPPGLRARAGWRFTPGLAVGVGPLTTSLFIGPFGGYAFGDYYGALHARRGYQAWAVAGPRVRDPLFGYYRAANVRNPGWERDLLATHRGRVAGDVARPPRDLAAQARLGAGGAVIAPPARLADAPRLTAVTRDDRVAAARVAEALRRASDDRRTLEAARPRPGEKGPALSLRDIPTPRLEAPKATTPRLEAPKATTPRVETPRPGGITTPPTPRIETPRTTPTPTPRIETPRTTPTPTPRIETPRTTPTPTPRIETPRVAPAPRIETPRVAPAPRIETPRVAPAPRPAPAPAPAPRMAPAPAPRPPAPAPRVSAPPAAPRPSVAPGRAATAPPRASAAPSRSAPAPRAAPPRPAPGAPRGKR
jgi:hypothetical protein